MYKNYIIESPKISKSGFIGYVYIFVNNTNNKIYVGKTTELYTKRWAEHKYNAFTKQLNTYLYKALRKYTWEGFSKYVIYQTEEFDNKDDVDRIIIEKEKYYINLFRSDMSDFGYNLTKGGDGIVGFKHSEETKQHFSEIRTGNLHPNYGNLNNSTSDVILQFDLDFNFIKEWPSMSEIGRQLNYKPNNISKCCSNQIGSYKGYIWVKKEDYYDGYLQNNKNRVKCKSNDKAVLQYDFLGNFIQEYISCSEAGKALNKGSVSSAANGRDPQLHGYIWIYKNDFSNELLLDKLEKVKKCRNYDKIVKAIRDYE